MPDAPEWFRRAVAVPFTDEHVEVGGAPIHYLAWGEPDRRGLVFVHGGGAHAHWWTHLAATFAETCGCWPWTSPVMATAATATPTTSSSGPRRSSPSPRPAASPGTRSSSATAGRGLVTKDIGASMYEAMGRVTPVIELPEAGHHAMLDQPLVLLTAIRTLPADWDHSEPHRPAAAAS